MTKNWKSALSSIVTVVAGFIVFKPELFLRWPWITGIAQYIMAGGMIAWGISKSQEAADLHDATIAKVDHNAALSQTLVEQTNGMSKRLEAVAFQAGVKQGEDNQLPVK